MQETHSTPDIERVWSNEWGNTILYSHGTSATKGVAILFDRSLPVRVEEVRTDLEGRILMANLELNNFRFVLVNIYAPNEDDPHFYIKLFQQVDARENNSLIIGGDFNTS